MGLTSFSTGFTVGFGSGLMAREIIPIARAVIRPLARAFARSAIIIVERSRELMARAGESFEDTYEEVRTELKQDQSRNVIEMPRQKKSKKRAKSVKSPRSAKIAKIRVAKITPLRREAA